MATTPMTIGITNILLLWITRCHHSIKAYSGRPLQFSHASCKLHRYHHRLHFHRAESVYTVDISYYNTQPPKSHPKYSFHPKNTIYSLSDPLSDLVTRFASFKRIVHAYFVIPSLPITFYLPDHPTNLLSYNHYPCFSISMSFNQSGSNASATFGTYNDVSGNQINTIQGDVNGQYFIFCYLSILINQWIIYSTKQ